MRKRVVQAYRDEVEKEIMDAHKAELEAKLAELKDKELEEECKAMATLRNDIYEAIDKALYGSDAELTHSDIIECVIEGLGDHSI